MELIEVVCYDSRWPEMFDAEKEIISAALGDNCIAIYHVGSTAVPGLAAKPKIDIVAVAENREKAISDLEKAGYSHRGEWNIPLKCGFTKRGATDVKLMVFLNLESFSSLRGVKRRGNPEIEFKQI